MIMFGLLSVELDVIFIYKYFIYDTVIYNNSQIFIYIYIQFAQIIFNKNKVMLFLGKFLDNFILLNGTFLE